MKVILCEDVDNLGDMGATVKVAPGYARNYLIPRKLAVLADSASAKQIEHEMRLIRKREERRRAEMQAVAKDLGQITVDIKVRAGEGDKIFGSVTPAQIVEKLEALGRTVDKKWIKLEEPIKSLGIFMVPIKLPGGVTTEIKVWVTALKESLPTTETAADADAATEEESE